MEFTVEFYVSRSGTVPVREFLDALKRSDPDDHAAIVHGLAKLRNTQVDRDILERLETPLAHLLRNAVDHGCETPAERERAGKPAEATIRLEARHSAGMLLVSVTDDGAGVQPERLRAAIANKKLALPLVAEKLSESELLDFLFLPGFTFK